MILFQLQNQTKHENWRGLGRESKDINFDCNLKERLNKYTQANINIKNSFNYRNIRSNFNSFILNENYFLLYY